MPTPPLAGELPPTTAPGPDLFLSQSGRTGRRSGHSVTAPPLHQRQGAGWRVCRYFAVSLSANAAKNGYACHGLTAFPSA